MKIDPFDDACTSKAFLDREKNCTMEIKIQSVLPLFLIPLIASSTSVCEKKPSLIQCIALRNQFILPLKDSCNPLKKNCDTGDLVDPRVANCHLEFSGNVFHSLLDGFKMSYGYRCFPIVPDPNMFHRRNVGPSYGEPRCVPTKLDKHGSFICGEHGTRCVCDAPAEYNSYGTQWLRNNCRCQYFVNLCRIPKVCASRGICKMWGSELRCECPADKEQCRPGINQCKANPGLCLDEGKICIELYDTNVGWLIGNEQKGDGFACILAGTVKSLATVTHYCDISQETFSRIGGVEPKNELDLCCYQMLTCAGGESIPKKGTIFSYRPCYCNVEFRKCLFTAAFDPKFKGNVEQMVEVLNNLAHCIIDDGVQCDPVRPWTCQKGDLINPKFAHCAIDCRTGPVLPIWARACALRQCKPPYHRENLRIIDVPRMEESSICKPVEDLPILCGNRETNTRCVCDGKPSRSDFTDRCRCQYWPDRWEERQSKEK